MYILLPYNKDRILLSFFPSQIFTRVNWKRNVVKVNNKYLRDLMYTICLPVHTRSVNVEARWIYVRSERFIGEGTEKCVLLFVYFLKKTIFDKMLFSRRSRFQIRKYRTTAVLCFRIDNNIIIAAVGDRANSHSRLLYTFYNTHRAAPRVYV